MTNLYLLPIKKLQAKADLIFSKYIRMRDTPGKCCTCGKFIDFKSCDAGHYMERNYKNTRYNEYNVHGQCRECNRFKNGEKALHRDYIDKEHGIENRTHLEYIAKITCPDYKFLLVAVIHGFQNRMDKELSQNEIKDNFNKH